MHFRVVEYDYAIIDGATLTAQASEHDECDTAKLFARAEGGSASLATECGGRRWMHELVQSC